MGTREEIKSEIIKAGFTIKEVVDTSCLIYEWEDSLVMD